MKRTKSKPTRRHARNQPNPPTQQKLPFIAHLYELRKRLVYVAMSVVAFGSLAYAANKPLTALLLRPAGDQQFIYTSPGGGFDFLFKLCLYVGIAASIPAIVYQCLRYMQPLIKQGPMRFIIIASLSSGGLAMAGVLFGYLYGLPAAMRFLLHGFSSDKIQALINIQSYMSFVMMYLLGAALLFQVPLILLLINRIKPLKPKKLMRFQRWFILIAFILGALLSPSPNVQDQLMLTGPMIIMYQVSIVMIWLINRRHQRPKKVVELLRRDAEIRAARLANFESARATWRQLVGNVSAPTNAPPVSAQKPAAPKIPSAAPLRPKRYLEEFSRRPQQPAFGRQTPQTE